MDSKLITQIMNEAGMLGKQTALESRAVVKNLLEDVFIEILSGKCDIKISFADAEANRYRGAIPFEINLYQKREVDKISCVGVDGSQIYPDVNNSVKFSFVVATGYCMGQGIIFSRGRNISAELAQFSDESNIQKNLVDIFRFVEELRIAKSVIDKFQQKKLVLLDGGLLPWMPEWILNSSMGIEILEEYISLIRSCCSGLFISVIDSPKSRAIINLSKIVEKGSFNAYRPARNGIKDSDIVYRFIKCDERTPIFLSGSKINEYIPNNLQICFFYLRVGENVLRIELPKWIAQNGNVVSLITQSVIEDSRSLGYPYTLAQAHNHIVIKKSVSDAVLDRAERAYLENGGEFVDMSVKKLVKGGANG